MRLFPFPENTRPSYARIVEGKRLAYYREKADSAYWDQLWNKKLRPDYYAKPPRQLLGYHSKYFLRYLPREGRILEAGCGLGKNVLGLRRLGYDCEGIDYASESIRIAGAACPDLPLRVGDVTNVDVPDGYYQAYISLGVVEHRKDGPEPFLKEAHRITADDGVLFVSVPYFNPLRRLKARMGSCPNIPEDLEFYQYAFVPGEMREMLARANLGVIDTFYVSVVNGLCNDIRLIKQLIRFCPMRRKVMSLLESSSRIGSQVGNIAMFVCKKV